MAQSVLRERCGTEPEPVSHQILVDDLPQTPDPLLAYFPEIMEAGFEFPSALLFGLFCDRP
jgi:hypothetical protein